MGSGSMIQKETHASLFVIYSGKDAINMSQECPFIAMIRIQIIDTPQQVYYSLLQYIYTPGPVYYSLMNVMKGGHNVHLVRRGGIQDIGYRSPFTISRISYTTQVIIHQNFCFVEVILCTIGIATFLFKFRNLQLVDFAPYEGGRGCDRPNPSICSKA